MFCRPKTLFWNQKRCSVAHRRGPGTHRRCSGAHKHCSGAQSRCSGGQSFVLEPKSFVREPTGSGLEPTGAGLELFWHPKTLLRSPKNLFWSLQALAWNSFRSTQAVFRKRPNACPPGAHGCSGLFWGLLVPGGSWQVTDLKSVFTDGKHCHHNMTSPYYCIRRAF